MKAHLNWLLGQPCLLQSVYLQPIISEKENMMNEVPTLM
jgi:hypothetical protein